MSGAKTVGATFTVTKRTLSVTAAGNGTGTVTSDPGINCGEDCQESYDHGTTVTLTATPSENSDFTGFTGCDDDPPVARIRAVDTCTVTMDRARDVTATFTLKLRRLTIQKSGNGDGAYDCVDEPCDYFHGTAVTITADPDANSDFGGFTGCDSTPTADTCTVTMTADRTVTANHTLKKRTLTVTRAGNSSGTVVSDPGIDCGSDCSQDYDHGTAVTLTANPAADTDVSLHGVRCDADGDDVHGDDERRT